jgi:hypothetical protein
MTLEQRLTDAARHVADGVVVPEVDLDAVRTDARANRRQRVAIARPNRHPRSTEHSSAARP